MTKTTNYSQKIKKLVFESAYKKYWSPLPSQIEERIIKELGFFDKRESYEEIYRLMHISKRGASYLQGNSNNVFIFYLLGITLVNPLPYHVIDKEKQTIKFVNDNEIKSNDGVIGFNLPFEVFEHDFATKNFEFNIYKNCLATKTYEMTKAKVKIHPCKLLKRLTNCESNIISNLSLDNLNKIVYEIFNKNRENSSITKHHIFTGVESVTFDYLDKVDRNYPINKFQDLVGFISLLKLRNKTNEKFHGYKRFLFLNREDSYRYFINANYSQKDALKLTSPITFSKSDFSKRKLLSSYELNERECSELENIYFLVEKSDAIIAAILYLSLLIEKFKHPKEFYRSVIYEADKSDRKLFLDKNYDPFIVYKKLSIEGNKELAFIALEMFEKNIDIKELSIK